MLNDWISFLFIKSKINLLLGVSLTSRSRDKSFNSKQVTEAVYVYEKQIRRYLGLGFFLSFIPQTEAFMARNALFIILKTLEEHVDKKISDFTSTLSITPLYFTISPLLNFVGLFLWEKEEFVCSSNPSNYLNPFKYFLDLLFLGMHFTGLPPNKGEGPNSFVLAAILLCLLIPSAILYMIFDFALNAIALFTLEPLIFAFEVIQQLITNWNDEMRCVPTAEYNGVRKIQKALNDADSCNLLASAIQVKTEEDDLTFMIMSPEETSVYNKYTNSIFFKKYKDELSSSTYNEKSIANEYHSLENLQRYYFFTKENYIPNDIFNETKDKFEQIEGTQLKDNNALIL